MIQFTHFIGYLERTGAKANTTKTENESPKTKSTLITKAQEELNRIKKSGCGFFMSQTKHKAKVDALTTAIASGNESEISLALKMHRSIAPFRIFCPESARALKR